MLCIHILNVSHGDSIVIEYQGKDGVAFGVIDSNRNSSDTPAALKKLRELGAKRLSFVALTHPHADHYKGLLDILCEYRGKIDSFYSYPLDHQKEGRLKDLAKIYGDIIEGADSASVRKNLIEFVKILLEAKTHIGLDNWEEHTGFDRTIVPVGFVGVDMHAILPLPSMKGEYFQKITGRNLDAVQEKSLNNLSVVYQLNYNGHTIILGGDASYTNWLGHQKLNRRREQKLEADAVKLPHHGSKEDCRKDTLKYMYSQQKDNFAFISANGLSHPHDETLESIGRLEIKPYCTNLAAQCGARNTFMLQDKTVDPELLLYLNRVLERIPGQRYAPCQGDISICIDNAGNLNVTPQYKIPCAYRGDFDFISESKV